MRSIATALVAACLAGASFHGAMAGDSSDPLSGVSAEMTRCTADEMCVVVDSLPCGCAQGGRHEAVNVEYRDLWTSMGQYIRSHAPDIVCVQQFNCAEKPRAACLSNRCRIATD